MNSAIHKIKANIYKALTMYHTLGILHILSHLILTMTFFFKILFISRERKREKDRERNISVWLPLPCHQLGTWPTIQERTLIGNRTVNPLVHRLALNPLSHTSQGLTMTF